MDALFERMRTDPRLYFLTADMGINMCERFEEAYPDRFLNVGIAEQNLIGVAAGLANAGFRPFAYTISNFLIHRALEQIRNDVLIHRLPVTLLGTSTGFDNAPLGPTHHIVDDWGPLAALGARIDIYSPASKRYAGALVGRILESGTPAYVRIAKSHQIDEEEPGDAVHYAGDPGSALLVTYGSAARAALEAKAADPSIGVLILQRLAPLPGAGIIRTYHRAIVIEDHFPWSGLYSRLCQQAMAGRWSTRIESAAPDDYSPDVARNAEGYWRRYQMDSGSLAARVNSHGG